MTAEGVCFGFGIREEATPDDQRLVWALLVRGATQGADDAPRLGNVLVVLEVGQEIKPALGFDLLG